MAWTSPSGWIPVSIALDGLADTSSAVGTTVINNGTAKDLYLDLSLRLGSFAPGGGGAAIELHVLPLQDDGASYPDLARARDVVPILSTAAGPKNLASTLLLIPPGTFKVAAVNRSGAPLAGAAGGTTANILAYRTYSPG